MCPIIGTHGFSLYKRQIIEIVGCYYMMLEAKGILSPTDATNCSIPGNYHHGLVFPPCTVVEAVVVDTVVAPELSKPS